MQQDVTEQKLDERLSRARLSLEGLSIGDAFGERFFSFPPATIAERIEARQLPVAPWPYTDDTQMALSIFKILREHQAIDQDRLAASFAERYEPSRGYGPAMHRLLRAIRAGEAWNEVASKQFSGLGSFGNGAAMRVSLVGAYFADDLEAVVEQASGSSVITHTHPEAIAGSIAIAIAAAWASRFRQTQQLPERAEFLDLILPFIPTSEVRAKTRWARDIGSSASVEAVVAMLGNGSELSAQDTVPFVLWCAGEQLNDYEQALWLTVSGLGDVDTNCAMVGGIVALYCGEEDIPDAWRKARESLPNWPFVDGFRGA